MSNSETTVSPGTAPKQKAASTANTSKTKPSRLQIKVYLACFIVSVTAFCISFYALHHANLAHQALLQQETQLKATQRALSVLQDQIEKMKTQQMASVSAATPTKALLFAALTALPARPNVSLDFIAFLQQNRNLQDVALEQLEQLRQQLNKRIQQDQRSVKALLLQSSQQLLNLPHMPPQHRRDHQALRTQHQEIERFVPVRYLQTAQNTLDHTASSNPTASDESMISSGFIRYWFSVLLEHVSKLIQVEPRNNNTAPAATAATPIPKPPTVSEPHLPSAPSDLSFINDLIQQALSSYELGRMLDFKNYLQQAIHQSAQYPGFQLVQATLKNVLLLEAPNFPAQLQRLLDMKYGASSK